MIYRLSLRRAAVDDMAEAEAYYAAESEGLDLHFRNEVARVLQRIEANPAIYPVSEKTPYRKATLRIFPFCIYYCVMNEKVVVIAVHHAKRRAGRWKRRAKP